MNPDNKDKHTRTSATPRLVKLSRPRLYGVVERERLFQMLDQAREHSVVWICGPPGSGKTILIVSYLKARDPAALWYQVDAGDGDPATFFSYLRQAIPLRSRAALPLFTAEYLSDLAGFTRRFFRALCTRLPQPAVLVLDNFHEAESSATFRQIAQIAAAEMPEGINLVAVSRTAPPLEFAGLQSSQSLVVIDWQDLQLHSEETQAIVAQRGLPQQAAAALHEHSGGWLAGLTLLVAHARRFGNLPMHSERSSPQVMFDYFATEIFAHASGELQHLWLRTAYLPQFTAAMAGKLSGGGAEKHLDTLARRHYFIELRTTPEASYQYNALFSEFLRQQVQQVYSPAEHERLMHRSAGLLEEQGEHAQALALFVNAKDWQAATRLILKQADLLISQGRWQTLHSWIGQLPKTNVDSTPWLLFWAGVCQVFADPGTERVELARAYQSFVEHNDHVGQALCACAVLESYFVQWGNFKQRDRWIDVLVNIFDQDLVLPSPSVELRVWSGLLLALFYSQPQHRLAQRCYERVYRLCSSELSASEQLTAATWLLMYQGATGTTEAQRAVVAQFSPLAKSSDVNATQRTHWLYALQMMQMPLANFETWRQANRDAQSVAVEAGLRYMVPSLRLFEVWIMLTAQEVGAARRELDALAGDIDPANANDVAQHRFLLSWLALLQNQPQLAREHADQAFEMVAALTTSSPSVSGCGGYSQALAECGELEQALQIARRARVWVNPPGTGILLFNALLFEADVLRRMGRREEFLALLNEAFATGRRSGLANCVQWLPTMMARLCAEALAANIESEYVAGLIKQRGLLAPDSEIEHWLWPVRIYTLGRFALVIDGAPFKATGKSQRRPLELLKALLALGGRDVSGDALIEALWPEDASAEPWKVLEITLKRLRQLLGNHDAISLRDGKLTLDARRCWVDAWAFERLANTVLRTLNGSDDIDSTLPDVMRLYQGAFLACEAEHSCFIALRERLRSRFLRLIHVAGQREQRALCFEQAQHRYEQALELEPLAEELYRALMHCLRQQGRHSEAIEIYRRCRRQLALGANLPLSPATEVLYRQLLSGQ